jgi:phosphohistidine phosphatase
MKTLLILRHAKSSWDDPNLADHDRPLAKRGKRDAPKIGQLLREEDLVPDLVISSTAKRAWHTAQAVAEASGYPGQIDLRRELYPGTVPDYIKVLHGLPDEYQCVMIVGHNPGMSELLEALTGENPGLPTAALAQVLLPIKSWIELQETSEGKLVNLWKPPKK